MKKLNKKGFTLIELLAVIVILAVVMGIAANSVLSSMNKSRGGSLADTAQVIANAFYTKYTESLVDGVPSDVYGDVLGSSGSTKKGYDFAKQAGGPYAYYISSGLAETFNINTSNYLLKDSVAAVTTIPSDGSIVVMDSKSGKFTVCMVANTSGNIFVSTYASTTAKEGLKYYASNSATTATSMKSTTTSTMWACSNGTKSW